MEREERGKGEKLCDEERESKNWKEVVLDEESCNKKRGKNN